MTTAVTTVDCRKVLECIGDVLKARRQAWDEIGNALGTIGRAMEHR